MTPARSVAASVVALGLAGTLTVPVPAFAAPATCDRPEHYAAQSSAELLRIDRLDLGPAARITNRRPAKDDAGRPASGSPDIKSSGTPKAGTGPDDGRATGPSGAPESPSASGRPGSSDDSGGAGGGAEVPGGPGSSTFSIDPPSLDAPSLDASEPAAAGVLPGAGGGSGLGSTLAGSGGGARTLPAKKQSAPTQSVRIAGGGQGGGGADPVVGGVGLGDARSVLIADGPVNSAGAARLLDGKVAGSGDRDESVVQQAPPVSPKANTRRTGPKKYGPMKVGAGRLSTRAVWAHAMACGNATGDTSTATVEVSRLTIAGGGSAALVRVPEKISSHSGTALRRHGGEPQSVSSATVTAGRMSLADNEVRIRVLRAPELRVSMTARGKGQVDYRPAIVEISGKNGKKIQLTTPGDYVEVTLSDEVRLLESLPARLDPAGEVPLPGITGLPRIGELEQTPEPGDKPGSTLRIGLGDVRQATEGNAVAARATAIRMTLTRNVDDAGHGPSGLVADLGIGMLEAAAVAPGSVAGRNGGGRDKSSRQGGAATQGGPARQGGSPTGAGAGAAGLPITGPGLVPMLITGAGLIVGGIFVIALTSRRRRNEP